MRRETQIGQIGRFTARTRDKVGDPFIKFHRIKAALIAAGLIDEAMAMDGVVSTADKFEHAWGFSGGWRCNVRSRGYDAALAAMKTGNNNSKNAERLISDLNRYRNGKSGLPSANDEALRTILSASGGKILSVGAYRRKFAKV